MAPNPPQNVAHVIIERVDAKRLRAFAKTVLPHVAPRGRLRTLVEDVLRYLLEQREAGVTMSLCDRCAAFAPQALPECPFCGMKDGDPAPSNEPEDIARERAERELRDGLTDVGNAQRFAAQHGDDVRYCAALGWLVWDGKRWARDETGEVEQRAKKTVRAIYKEAADADDPRQCAAIAAHAKASEAATRIAAMLSLAKSEASIVARADAFDRNPWLFNCANGTIDLETGELREHRRSNLITKLAPVAFDSAAKCPTWDAFLSHVMGERPELVELVQRWIGYGMTASTREQKMALLYGTGSNGKSTLLNALHELLGDYARQGAPQLLLSSRLGDRHPTEVADLHGARFVIVTEVERGRSLAEVTVKQLTGGDPLKARYMHRDFFQFAPSFKLTLACNSLPVVHGQDEAIWRRLVVVPFEVVVPPEERDVKLAEKLARERPGILNWALAGCRAWLARGLAVPPVAVAASADYREDSDLLGDFFAEFCAFRKGAVAVTADLFDCYVDWHTNSPFHDEDRLTVREFCSTLRERGCLPKKLGHGARGWTGVELVKASGGGFRPAQDPPIGASNRHRVAEVPPASDEDCTTSGGGGGSGPPIRILPLRPRVEAQPKTAPQAPHPPPDSPAWEVQ